jgi:hypothetical protein
MQFLLVFGLSYQLPIIMYAITQFKIVKPIFWGNNLRYVIIILVIFAAVITPDGSEFFTDNFARTIQYLRPFSKAIKRQRKQPSLGIRAFRLLNIRKSQLPTMESVLRSNSAENTENKMFTLVKTP